MCCLGIWVPSRNWEGCVTLVSPGLSKLYVPALKQLLRAPVSQIRSVGWHFLEVCIELLWCGSSDMLCSWLCQPRPHTVATDFHLYILSWRTLGFVSSTGCVPGLKHSTIALSCCFAVWSVVGLEITNLSPAPPLGTTSCPGKQGSPHLSKLSVHVFMLLPGYWDCVALPVKFSGPDCSTDLEAPFPAHA